MVQVPATTADADASFVTSALRSTGVIGSATSVAEVEHDTIGEGVGIVGQLARLQLRYDGPATGAPGTVIMKIPSQYPENRAVGDHFNFYEREGRFYQQLADKVPVRTPDCYWNHIDVASGAFGLLLEDLGDRTMISQVAGIPGLGRPSALRALARIHGTWWGSPPSTSSTGCRASTSPSTSPPGSSTGTRGRSSWSASRTPSPTAGSRSASGCSRPSRTCSSPAWPRRRPRSATVTSAATTSCSTTAPIPPTPTTRWRSSTGRSRTAVRRSPTSPTSSASR